MKKLDLRSTAKQIAQFILNPRLLLCVGVAWMITNGWSYVMLGVGSYYGIGWMVAVAGAYLAFLWLPISPEKIVTFAIAIALLRLIFPHDEKTLGVLIELYGKAKSAIKKKRQNGKNDGHPPSDSESDSDPGRDC